MHLFEEEPCVVGGCELLHLDKEVSEVGLEGVERLRLRAIRTSAPQALHVWQRRASGGACCT